MRGHFVSIFVVCSVLTASGAFAKDAKKAPERKPSSVDLAGAEAKSLFFSLVAISSSGGKVNTNSNSVRDGFQTSYWVDSGDVQCTQSKMKSGTSYSCSVAE